MNEFNNAANRKTLEEECREVVEQMADSDKALQAKRQEIAELKTLISGQECSSEQFEELKRNVAALRLDLQLQQERIQCRIDMIGNCDFEVEDVRQKLQQAVHKYNMAVVKLQRFNSKMSALELKSTGYAPIKEVTYCFFRTALHVVACFVSGSGQSFRSDGSISPGVSR